MATFAGFAAGTPFEDRATMDLFGVTAFALAMLTPEAANAPGPRDLALAVAARASASARLAGTAAARASEITPPERSVIRAWGAPLTLRAGASTRITLPGGCEALASEYDVLVHFHGVETSVEPAFVASGLAAVLVLVNAGEMSGPYERAFSGSGALDHLLAAATYKVEERCGAGRSPGRVALSAWSAGYGAVLRIIERPPEAERIDAVLLADGLHVGYEEGGSRRPSARQLRPFTAFALDAAEGRKLFVLSHSSVKTDHYASTTETADALMESVGAPRRRLDEAGPRPGMWLESEGGRRGFHVLGYSGDGRRDHCDQLRAIGATLFPLLLERWSHLSPRRTGPRTDQTPEASPIENR